MIKVTYTELDGPSGPTLRLEAAGHAGYAPAGQDIVCAGASTLMQTLVYLLAGEESAKSDAWDEPEGPRLAVTAAAPRKPWVEGAFEFAKAGFALLAERYPDNVRFADLSGRGEQCMVDLQLFAEGEGGVAPPPVPAPALSRAQQQQAIASGTMKAAEAEAPAQPPREAVAEEAGETEQPEPAAEKTDDVPLNRETARRFAAVLQQEKQLMQDAQGREELDHMQTTTTAICDWLEAHPESLPKARRFAEYYIPTTLKLLHTYNDVQGQQGENAETIRRDIAGILHTLNQAYDTLYDTLLSDVAMDVSSEIAALQGMLANDGLTGGNFE